MRIVKSTRKHKLHYAFPTFVEFDYTPQGMAQIIRWGLHFKDRYGPSTEWRMIEGRKLSTLCYNTNWREERNAKAKRLRIYIKDQKDLTWAQLALA